MQHGSQAWALRSFGFRLNLVVRLSDSKLRECLHPWYPYEASWLQIASILEYFDTPTGLRDYGILPYHLPLSHSIVDGLELKREFH